MENTGATKKSPYEYPGSHIGIPLNYAQQRMHTLMAQSQTVAAATSDPDPASHIGRAAEGGRAALERRLDDEAHGRIKPLRLGWTWLNRALGNGLTPGQVTILAGPAGVAKSYLLLNMLRRAWVEGTGWRLLPLEDDAGRWAQRMLAVCLNSWDMVSQPISDDPEDIWRNGERKLAAVRNNQDMVDEMYRNIFENPRLPVDDGHGGKAVREVRYTDILDLVEAVAPSAGLVGIDCLSQVDFSANGLDYLGQADFMRRLVGLAAATGTHVVLVAHHAKRGKQGASSDPLDAIQGSAMFSRLAHNVLVMARHDPAIESQLFSTNHPQATHSLTLSVLKCRGGHSGQRVAFDLDGEGPTFVEHGRVKPIIKN